MWLCSKYILDRIANESKAVRETEVKNGSNVFLPLADTIGPNL